MEQSTQTKTILVALLVLLILAGGYIWFKNYKGHESVAPAGKIISDTETKPKDNVEVTQVDLNAENTEVRLPEGFPTNIPLEISGIFESYSAVYETQGVTQYTVSYNSSASKSAKWDEYNSFMTKESYAFDKNATSKSQGTLSGTKDKDSLLAVVSAKGDKTIVQLNLLRR